MAGFGGEKEKKKSTIQRNTRIGGEAFYKLAIDHHLRGDLMSAENAYREIIATGCIYPGVFSNLGVICKNSGRPEEAIVLYKKAII